MFNKTLTGEGRQTRESPVFAYRLLTAALQAAALYFLMGTAEQPRSWPAT